MNRSVILLIALIFINNCSLNENSRIWKDKELSTQPKLKKVFEEKKIEVQVLIFFFYIFLLSSK